MAGYLAGKVLIQFSRKDADSGMVNMTKMNENPH